MATKRKRQGSRSPKIQKSKDLVGEGAEMEMASVVEDKKEEEWGESLDPQEEKVLDMILKGVVIFILGWLGLSILLVIGGYFGMWK